MVALTRGSPTDAVVCPPLTVQVVGQHHIARSKSALGTVSNADFHLAG